MSTQVVETQVISTTRYPKGVIETVYSGEGLYLRAFFGKGRKEVCYKTNIGDVDILSFAIKLGYEVAG